MKKKYYKDQLIKHFIISSVGLRRKMLIESSNEVKWEWFMTLVVAISIAIAHAFVAVQWWYMACYFNGLLYTLPVTRPFLIKSLSDCLLLDKYLWVCET